MKIKNKLILGISIMLSVLAILLSVIMYFEIKKSTEAMVEERLSDQVKNICAVAKEYEKLGYSEKETISILRETFYSSDKEFPKNLKVKIAGKGFSFILDSKGTNVVHPALEGKNLIQKNDGFKKMYEQKNGVQKYISPKNGKWKITVFSDDAPYGWIIASTAFRDMIIGEHVIHLMKINSIVIFSGLIIFLIITYFFISAMIKPLNKITDKLNEIASGQGDLTSTIDINSKDEVGKIAEAFNKFLYTIKNMIIEVSNSSKDVNDTSLKLEEVSIKTQNIFENLNDIIQEIVRGAKEQENDIATTKQAIDGLSDEIAKIYGVSSTMKNNSLKIQDSNEVSKEGLLNIEKSNDKSVDTINMVNESIQDLYNQINRISEVTKMINDISSQTNLLSLNASIEAARAGEAGKGFAVVADEVSKLAVESNKYAEEISSIISDIENKVTYTINLSKEVKVVAEEQVSTVDKSKDDFNKVDNLLSDILININNMDDGIKKTEETRAAMIGYIDRLFEISQEFSQSTSDVSKLSTDFNNNIQNLSEGSLSLRESSDNLMDMVSQFKY